ncbi:MAG TPA: ABC transporter ATP-binding protein [Thermoplasmata archaeon]|nr:ABC transporter ATP-binding protein [Thermoplasmata archaeon]
MSSELLVVERLTAAWGPAPVLREVSLEVREGELVTLIGPNGAGKSTLLRCIVGLEETTGGSVRLRGAEITGTPTHRRGIGLVAQEPSLFGHRTVRENIAYGPLVQGTAPARARARVDELLELLGLAPLADRRPGELSGGEQQKTALARALAPSPAVVLLDEPFAAVDPEFRAELRSEFRRILSAQRTSALHVTHDRAEGLFLGDRVLVMLDGRIEQSSPPEELQAHPASPRIARFLGYNLLAGPSGTEAVAPEALRVVPPEAGMLVATIIACGFIGNGYSVHLRSAHGENAEAWVPADGPRYSPGARVGLRWDRSIRFAGAVGSGSS